LAVNKIVTQTPSNIHEQDQAKGDKGTDKHYNDMPLFTFHTELC